MRTSHAYRPTSWLALEDRAVPTAGLGGLDGLFGNLIHSVPAQDAGLVRQAFNTFEQTYVNDVNTILLAPTTNPAAARAAFDAAVLSAIAQLNASIDLAIANLPTADALSTTVHTELVGPGQTTLQGRLTAIPTPITSSIGNEIKFLRTAYRDTESIAGAIGNQVRSAPAPAGAIDPATLKADLKAVDAAFSTFRASYKADVDTVLAPPGTADPSVNRAAFDSAVAKDLAILNANVAAAVGNLPASVTSSLLATLKADLLTSTRPGDDLQSRLAALKTPKASGGFATLLFRLAANFDTYLVEGRVAADILAAARAANASSR